ncbi:MAG: hypothetical protein WC197_07765 [Candidatus Gastranaerophilaceae bacterium]
METQNKNNKYLNFSSNILCMPLWIKEVIYLQLKKNLDDLITEDFLDDVENREIFQLVIPKLTYKGKKELENREKKYLPQIYRFLEETEKDYKIIEMLINNFWTLEECSKYYTDCIENELINKPNSTKIIGSAQFLSGKIRIGEYFVRTDKISIDQLNEALKHQIKTLETTGNRIQIATILKEKGFILEQDFNAILKIKEESKKRFIFNFKLDSFQSSTETTDKDMMTTLQEQNTKLLQENKILKEQLRKILNLSSQNKK